MPNFVLIGAAGYVAPRHMAAIKAMGGNLLACLDPHDSVGILDSYFPECRYFNEFERFDRYCDKLTRQGISVDYVSICSPNYLHDSHCRFALRIGADAICEKPLVLTERNLDALKEIEEGSSNRIWTIFQLRSHPEALKMKKQMRNGPHIINVDYLTPRGSWYQNSWKSNLEKSGGVSTNIGVHLFDLCHWLVGGGKIQIPPDITFSTSDEKTVLGSMRIGSTEINYRLSIDNNGRAERVFNVDGKALELSGSFTDLHTEVYERILANEGTGLEDARASVQICEAIRQIQYK
jgi:UDP-N-acetyl-2-amino-2-deoxyglucuronate dehydrogenase